MELNRERLAAMRTTYNMLFEEGFKQASTNWKDFCMLVGDQAHTTVEFPFLKSFAFMREWIGPRQIKNLETEKLKIVERAFEDTVSIPLRDVQTDNWGHYGHILTAMGQGCEALWDRLAADAILNPVNWIDGKPFFSTDREYGDGNTVCNTDSGALTAANFEKAYQTMQLYNAHNGEPLEVIPDLLIVGPENRAAAWEILKAQYVPDTKTGALTVTNRNFNLAEIQVNPRIRGKYRNFWFLAQTKGVVKPVVLQQSVKGTLVALDQENDESVFRNNEIIYGCKAFGNAAAAFPHLIYRGGSTDEE